MTTVHTSCGKPVIRDGKIATDAGCCCQGACCFCLPPCCPVYVGWSTNCNGEAVDGFQAVSFPAGSCISNPVVFEFLCCVGNFQCPMAVRVRAVCTGLKQPGNCSVGCTYVLEYASLTPGGYGNWSTNLTYLTANGQCNCNGTLLSVSVEQRLQGVCAGGEPEATASTCSDAYHGPDCCRDAGGIWHPDTTCEANPCSNPFP